MSGTEDEERNLGADTDDDDDDQMTTMTMVMMMVIIMLVHFMTNIDILISLNL